MSSDDAEVPSETKKRKKNTSSLLQSKIEEMERENQKRQEQESQAAAEAKAKARELKEKLAAIENPEERLSALQIQYNGMLKENKRLEKELSSIEAQSSSVAKERDKLKLELSKARDSVSTLENLCRELQKSKNLALEESRRVASDAEQRHSDLTVKFETTLTDIQQKMETDGDDRLKRAQETQVAKTKLLNFMEQYEVRDKHFATQMKAKDLEYQLAEAKLAQQTEICRQVAIRAAEYEKSALILTQVEGDLRAQLDMYKEKFQDFQAMMEKSNDLLTTFKEELDKNAKRIVKLEQEKHTLSGQNARTELRLIDAAKGEKSAQTALSTLAKKEEKLQSLCRALQKQNSVHRRTVLGLQDLGARLAAKLADGGEINGEDLALLASADFGGADDAEHAAE